MLIDICLGGELYYDICMDYKQLIYDFVDILSILIVLQAYNLSHYTIQI